MTTCGSGWIGWSRRRCCASWRLRDDERAWRFGERILSFRYYLPVADYAARLPSAERIGVYGERKAADFPESLDSWREWFRRHGRTGAC